MLDELKALATEAKAKGGAQVPLLATTTMQLYLQLYFQP